MFSDPISDMLTRVRNALGARQSKVEVPASRLKIDIVRILKQEGYIANYRVADEEGKRTIKIYLKYQPDHTPVISRLERVSKPGRRVYSAIGDLKRERGGLGISILSTGQGVLSDAMARDANVGGEVLCRVF